MHLPLSFHTKTKNRFEVNKIFEQLFPSILNVVEHITINHIHKFVLIAKSKGIELLFEFYVLFRCRFVFIYEILWVYFNEKMLFRLALHSAKF